MIGLRTAVDDRKNSDRLTAHPVEVEAERGIDRGAAFRAAALNEQQVSRRVGANHSGLGREAVHQLQQRLRRHILQRHDGDAVAGFGAGGRRIDPACADRVAERRQTIAGGVANKHDSAEPQGIFEHEDNVRLGNRPDGYQADGALHPRIDRVACLQDVAQHHLGDGGDRRVFEIEFKAVAGCDRLRPRLGDVGHLGAFEHHRAAALAGIGLGGIHLLRITRQGVERADLVEHVDIGAVAGTHGRRNCRMPAGRRTTA